MGSQNFLDTPLAQTPANLGPKSCFLVSYSQAQVVYQMLASTVAEINRGPKFVHAPLAQTPINIGPESCFW